MSENIWLDILNKIKEKVDEFRETWNLKDSPITHEQVRMALKEKAEGKELDWENSIVDLLKLLGEPSSLESRKVLAVELGCPDEYIKPDYAEMNGWLIREVMSRIAQSGGDLGVLN